MRIALAALPLSLAACTAPEEAPQAPASDAATPAPQPGEPAPGTQGSVETLDGYWRLGGLDGGDLTGIALTGTRDTLYWEPPCAGFSLDYRIEGNRISFAGERPGLVCEIGYPGELEAVFDALRAAKTIERTPSNGIRIAGGGRSVTLYSQ